MALLCVNLVDKDRRVLATARVAERGEGFAGIADLSGMPASMRKTFEEFDEIVNNQVFGMLDEIEDRIQDLRLKIRFENGTEVDFEDLQLYPSTGCVSFKVAKLPSQDKTRTQTQ